MLIYIKVILGAIPTSLVVTPGTGPIHLSQLACTGSESRLSACPSEPPTHCTHSDDAGVICQIGNAIWVWELVMLWTVNLFLLKTVL